MTEKRVFQVGDRVRVYSGDHSPDYRVRTGVVVQGPNDIGLLYLRFADKERSYFWAHPKQCRRLVKRERREWFVAMDGGDVHTFDGVALFKSIPPHLGHYNWVRVREVRR